MLISIRITLNLLKMRKVLLLGSTGSIGRQSLDVVRFLNHKGYPVRVVGLAVNRNTELLMEQVEEFSPDLVAIVDASACEDFRSIFPRVFCGNDGVLRMLEETDCDTVINAITGTAGLLPGLTTLKMGKRLCLANKESLVAAGPLFKEAAKQGGELLPIDSEHSAIFQGLFAGKQKEVARLILTASGGPLWNKDVDFGSVTVDEAISHPTWSMGRKISVDSATMMNKGLEIIEAHYLFDVPPEQIEVLIHPQSIVHSIVEFIDHSQIAQMSLPDMRLAIQYAITYPARFPSPIRKLNLDELGHLTFYPPDRGRFPSLDFAYMSLKKGGTYPACLNAANEAAVSLFLDGRIRFSDIFRIIEKALGEHKSKDNPSLEDILNVDREVKEAILSDF